MAEVQYVGVEFRSTPGRVYSYQWYSEERTLRHGDRVWVPANWANPQPSLGDVVTLYANREAIEFKGELATIIGVDDDG